MEKFKKLLDELLSIDRYEVKFDIDTKTILLLTETGILHGYTISINKNYKGYSIEITEWASPAFGKVSKYTSTKQKDILDFIKNKVGKRNTFMFSD